MDFKSFWSGLSGDEKMQFAERCGTTVGHLRNIAYGKLCGEDLAMAVDMESAGAVKCEELRPDLSERWAYLRGAQRKAA